MTLQLKAEETASLAQCSEKPKMPTSTSISHYLKRISTQVTKTIQRFNDDYMLV